MSLAIIYGLYRLPESETLTIPSKCTRCKYEPTQKTFVVLACSSYERKAFFQFEKPICPIKTSEREDITELSAMEENNTVMHSSMELYKEILVKALSQEEMHVTFPDLLQLNANEIIEARCYQALQKIQAIIHNDDLSDFACIEEIVRVFEELGSGGGTRHDF